MDFIKEELQDVINKVEGYIYNDNEEIIKDLKSKIELNVINIDDIDLEKCVQLIQDEKDIDAIYQEIFEGKVKGEKVQDQKQIGNPSLPHIIVQCDQPLLDGKKEEEKPLYKELEIRKDKKEDPEVLNNASSIPFKEEKQGEIMIIIRVSNPHFYEKLMKKKEDISCYNFNLIFKNALSHIKLMKNNRSVKSYFEKKAEEKGLFLFKRFEATKLESGAGKGIELLPDNFEYRLLPSGIEIIAKTDSEEVLLKPQTKINVHVERNELDEDEDEIILEKEQLYFRRFKCFLKYFQGKPFSLINSKLLETATQRTIKKFNGIEPFMKKFREKMNLFASKCYSTPKGILLYGPPGTGKSAITKTLCEELGVVFATAPMAAGDLKKGIQGDSEKTINEIAMRCKLVPWEMCVLLIDEIDSLAPDRTAEKSSTGSQDLIGVLLATLDGSKETKNMKIIASTNLLNKIDKAFLRRMEIQLFLGNPNKSSRISWIEAKIKQAKKDINFVRIRRFAKDEEFEELRNFVVSSTINFSADAYRKLLDRFYHALLIYEKDPSFEDYKTLLNKKILGVSEEMKIYLKSTPVPSIIDLAEKLSFNQMFLGVFHELAEEGGFTDIQGRKLKALRKVLIDLSSGKNNLNKPGNDTFHEVFQLPCKNETRLSLEEEEVLTKLKKGLNSLDKSLAASNYLFAIMYFSEVSHFNASAGKYNLIRDRVLKEDFVDRIVTIFTKASLKAHFLDNNQSQLTRYWIDKVVTTTRAMGVQPDILLGDFIQSIDQYYDKTPLKILQLLNDPERYQLDWLPLIVKFALNYDADVVKLIDNNFIVNNSALNDSAATSLISSVVSETKNYDKSVIIFDLDSISQIKKEYQALKQDIEVSTKIAIERGDNEASFSYTVQRPQTFQTILDILRKVDSDSKCWFFAVSKHPKIVLDFKEALKWPSTPSVMEYEQKEIEMEKLYRCQFCNEIFNERQNLNEFKCYRHTKEIVLFDNPKKAVGSKEKPKLMSIDDALELIRKGNDVFEMNFRYACCGTVLGGKGHEPFKHKKGEEVNLEE